MSDFHPYLTWLRKISETRSVDHIARPISYFSWIWPFRKSVADSLGHTKLRPPTW